MDMRACPSYEAGFDACDPLGSVLEWSGRGAARVLRRRCHSEGVDRSPYEDAPLNRSVDIVVRDQRVLPDESQFYLNTALEARIGRFSHEFSPRAAENGDHDMSHDHNSHYGYPQGRSKYNRKSPTRPLVITTSSNTKLEDRHLPKVEELLEKVDQEMIELPVTKQPFKSILNNPFPKSVPQGILKKPKNKAYQDSKASLEGRRRQRASSESDNLYCGFHLGTPISGYDGRLSHIPGTMKRAKDNSGTGYSYGSALATLINAPVSKPTAYSKNLKCICKEPAALKTKDEVHNMHILRTTAISNETVNEDSLVEAFQTGYTRELAPSTYILDVVSDVSVYNPEELPQHMPTPTCPVVSPALPVSSVTALPVAKFSVKANKKKIKPSLKNNMKLHPTTDTNIESETDDASRSPSPDGATDSWHMETDLLISEIKKLEKVMPQVPKPPPTPVKKDEPHDHSSNTKLASKLNGTAVLTSMAASRESPLNLPEHISSCIRPSLFPRVPPYLKFASHDETAPLKVPLPIQKHLKWKLTTITPIVVKKTLTNSGFRLMKSECDTAECPQEETVEWVGIWGKHMKSLMFRAIKDGQKMNHFPGTFQIGRKDRLWRNLQKLVIRYGAKEFGIMPKSYILPHDLKMLKHDWEKHSENSEKWIIKPPASARGTGIKVVSRWTQIPKKRPVVVQKYVSKPYLINGNKFDMRLYVLVTSVHPLRIYLYKDGLARFASVKYNDEVTSLNDRYMHLTNYSINRLSKNYTPNEDFAACEGHKWTLQTLFHYLKTEKDVDTKALWESMKDLVIKTIISGEASISSLTKANITSRYNCYELFGVDVLLDEDLKPWLLEVNISPSLHSASPLDIHVKGPLVSTVLNIAQFQVPIKTNLDMLAKEKPHKLGGLPYDSRLYTVYLSKEERDKHIIYTNMDDRDIYLRDILSTLTPDDVRHLIQAEDELTQSGDMERVFPTRETYKYLGYLTGARYYNRLFDAWETRYSTNRDPGIDLLRNLCDIGYHLEVPPVPLKNDVDAPSPAVTERPSPTSLTSLERSPSAGSLLSAGRLCCDHHPRPPGSPALEPRA